MLAWFLWIHLSPPHEKVPLNRILILLVFACFFLFGMLIHFQKKFDIKHNDFFVVDFKILSFLKRFVYINRQCFPFPWKTLTSFDPDHLFLEFQSTHLAPKLLEFESTSPEKTPSPGDRRLSTYSLLLIRWTITDNMVYPTGRGTLG